jgi:hypothetical protein
MATYFSIKPGCTFHAFHNGSSRTEYVVKTADRRQFKISEAARKLLRDLDRGLSVEQIHAQMSTEQPGLTCEDLNKFILAHYGALLESRSGQQFALSVGAKPRMGLLISGMVLPPSIVGKIASACAWLYGSVWSVATILLVLYAHWKLYSVPTASFYHPTHVIIVLSACIFSVVVHEFGHASAVARFGGSPGGIGAGLYILLPVFYADVSQIWTLLRWQRIVVDLGGVYFQQLSFAVFSTAALALHDASLRAACVGIDVMTLITINPIFRFDGYWIVADWLGLSNLHRAAMHYLKTAAVSLLKGRPALLPDQAQLRQSRAKLSGFLLYSVLGNLLFAWAVLMNLRWISSSVTGVLKHVPVLATQTIASLHAHHWLHAIDLATAIVFLCASGITLLVAVYLRGKQISAAIYGRGPIFRGRNAVPNPSNH